MYLGIDLGTSNSAIAGADDGLPRIFKTAEGSDVLPSVIHLDKRGHRFVGLRAYDRIFTAPENVAQGFKRAMGTSTPITFAGASWTPEECSAEILRALVAQARVEGGEAPVDGAVITVPAAFNQMQSEATVRAAALAGLDRVTLLQEPVAAAMASISRRRDKNGMFLVYDLGGGTFDVALVQSASGAVSVIAHEGINMLGGRDFDRMLFENKVRPWLLDTFDLPADFQREPAWRRLIGISRHAVEKAKIDLSAAEVATVFAGDEEIRLQDRAGEDIYISVELTRRDLDNLVRERIIESIELCRKTLSDNGLGNEDVERVVLIGGPSKMPIVREMVPYELGIAVDQDLDPMTAVAIGAAIFAESRDWSTTGSRRKTSRGHEETAGEVKIAWDYQARVSGEVARLRVTLDDAAPAGCTLDVIDTDGRSSGSVPLNGSATVKLSLPRPGENRFRATVRDGLGRVPSGGSHEFTVTRTEASAAAITAAYTLAVKVIDGRVGYEKNVLEPLLRKNSPLPADGVTTVRAARALRGGRAEKITMQFFQQSEGIADPELNLCIGDFVLDAEVDLDPGEILPRGGELRIRWAMDDNGLLQLGVESPDLGRVIDGRNLYAPEAHHRNFEGERGAEIASEAVLGAEGDLARVQEVLGPVPELRPLRDRIERCHANLASSTEADAHRMVAEEARKIRQDASLLQRRPEHRAALTQSRLEALESDFPSEHASAVEVDRFDRLAATARRAVRSDDFDEADRAIEAMHDICGQAMHRDPAFVVRAFRYFAPQKLTARDPALHDRLVEEGLEAAHKEDINALRDVVLRLARNSALPEVQGAEIVDLADLMRA
ncbi:Hsp70 family protein [Acuticoccus sp. M5D2P5]|uniref:Hsp70 family protein n=1 Tax=Acuticoccus kalidii TaxID=2910977 RepID=UPI001F2250D1|nr:Hsp70 family protein [Acuticoccus kalidii]MCF3935856.1 Hsp70 family protein [Acuticoccus kalidii]